MSRTKRNKGLELKEIQVEINHLYDMKDYFKETKDRKVLFKNYWTSTDYTSKYDTLSIIEDLIDF